MISLLIIQFITAGCIEKKTENSYASDITRDYPVYGMRSVPDNLYMLQNETAEEKNLLSMVYSGLVKADAKGNIVPSLAESWVIDKDNTTYTFNLRGDLYWSDGIAISADDFVKFFRQICKPGFNNQKLYELECIKGIKDYSQSKKDFSSAGISAKNEKTLVIKLDHPCSYFLNILSEPEYTLKRIDSSLTSWTENIKNIVSSGPFLLDSIVKDSSGKRNIVLLKNNRYWDKDRTVSKKILIVEENDCESAMADFETGKIDLFVSPPESERVTLFQKQEAYLSNFTSSQFLFFNLQKDEPGSDIDFRKAVNYMISRKDLIIKDEEQIISPKCSFLEGSSAKYFSSKDNNEYAVKLLQKVKTKNYYNLTVVYDSEDPSKKIYERIAKILGKNLKCKIELIGLDKKDLESRLNNNDFDIAMLSIENNPESDILEFERLINIQKQLSLHYNSTDMQVLNRCENNLFSDMPFIPICRSKLVICRNTCITGMNVLNNGCIDFQAVYILKNNSK